MQNDPIALARFFAQMARCWSVVNLAKMAKTGDTLKGQSFKGFHKNIRERREPVTRSARKNVNVKKATRTHIKCISCTLKLS